MPDRMDEIEAMLRSGQTITYEIAAELFELTGTGRSTGLTREQAIERLRTRFPTEQLLTAAMRGYLEALDKIMAGIKAPLH